MFRRLFALGSALFLSLSACAPGSELESIEEADLTESELTLSMETVNVTKSNADPGLTIITKKAEYVAFFGTQPPASLNFNKSWLLHYSMGVQNTGGYAASFVSVDREGTGANANLVIRTHDQSPGPNCFVTQALTNPQAAVKIPKQKKAIQITHANDAGQTDCGTVQNWCATALCGPGQVCDEFVDACVDEPFCPKVKCANGYECSEDLDQCIGRLCDPEAATGEPESCPANFVCDNQIQCITQPCPAEYRCEPAPPADVTCAEIGWNGVCQGNILKYCSSNEADDMTTQDCAPGSCVVNQQGFADCYE